MFQEITLQEFLKKQRVRNLTVIDVRSPKEFQEFAIPGSTNIPVFSDEEREEIGTLYKQVSPEAAKERGLELFSSKLPEFVRAFRHIEGDKMVYCWRGGMRSKTAATILELAGEKAFRLQGGIRSYRKWVVDCLKTMDIIPEAIVLNGLTGSGKTKILHHLKKNYHPVLDLEGYANHRGSIFGPIGREPYNQKKFESLLVHDLLQFEHSPYLLMEGESKRIGKAVIPEIVMQKKETGLQLFLELPIEQRVQQILEDYQPWDHREACLRAFLHIKKRIHTPIADEIEKNMTSGCYGTAVYLLLKHYYDPRYQYTSQQYDEKQKVVIQANTIEEACSKVEAFIISLEKKKNNLQPDC